MGVLKVLKKISLNFELKDNGELIYQTPKHTDARIDIEIQLLFCRPFQIRYADNQI